MANIVEIVAKFINEASPGLKQVGQDVDSVGKKEQETGKSTEGMGLDFEQLGAQLLATVGIAGVVTGAFALMKSSVDAYGESEVVAAQVNAVLQSTQGIAGVTAEEVDKIAESLSRMSGQDDEAIKRGEALMLTFTKVGEEVFPKATEAALNMSMAMGTDLQSSIIQVGKALNDPIEGASALRRVGVQLTDQQEEQIKAFMEMNDIAGAQGIILKELNTEFGGVAETMGDTSVGATNKLKVAWGNLLESMGERPATGLKAIEEDTADFLNTLSDATSRANAWQEAQAALGNEIELDGHNVGVYRNEIMAYAGEVERATGLAGYWEDRLASTTETTLAANDALSEYVPNFEKLFDMSRNIADETERYNDKQQNVIDKQAEVKAQIDELIALGWSPLSDKVKGLQQDYDDLGMKYQENAANHQDAMNKIIYDNYLAKLSVDGLTDAEYNMANQAGLALGQLDQNSINTARNIDLVTQAVTDGKMRAEDMDRALKMMEKGYSINVVIEAVTRVTGALSGSNPQAEKGGYGYQGAGYADGGISTGSDAGHWELLHGTEAVIPLAGGAIPVQLSGSSSMTGGGNVVYQINLTMQSTIGLADEQTAQSVLLPYIIQGVKQAQSEGVLSNG